MRTYPLRVFVSLVAILGLLLTNVAVAQDETELPQTQAECEAAGYMWFPAGAWGFPDRPAQCADVTPVEPAPVEPAPVEPAPAAELPATQPATAQQGSPQYTG